MKRRVNLHLDSNNSFCVSNTGGPFFEIDPNVIEELGFIPEPPNDYEPPEKFPECCEFHKKLLEYSTEWFENFPMCCKGHIEISKRKWFVKSKYSVVPLKILNTVSYTEYQVSDKIESENWLKEITDYIDYCLGSFGNPAIGWDRYLNAVYSNIESTKKIEGLDENKRSMLLEYINKIRSPNDVNKTDPNRLVAIFQKWLKSFPDLVFFDEIKKKMKNKIPMNLIFHEGVYNPYLKSHSLKIRTTKELLELLIEMTQNLLSEFDSKKLIIKGVISNEDTHSFDLISSEHSLKQKMLLNKYSESEKKYIALIKEWLKNEKEYFKEISPIFKNVSNTALKENKQIMNEKLENIVERLTKEEGKLSLLLLESRPFFLKDKNILDFIDAELNGYSEDRNDPLPEYRNLKGEILADLRDPYGNIQSKVEVDTSEFTESSGFNISNVQMTDGIGFIEDMLINLKSANAHRRLPNGAVNMLGELIETNNPGFVAISAVHNLYTPSIKNILTSVRNFLTTSLQQKMSNSAVKVEIPINDGNKVLSQSKISVFVTYAWEEDTNETVISFVDFLLTKGYNASMDRSITQSETSTDFNEMMAKGIVNADKVIIILSEKYKERADNFIGGVGAEYRMILNLIKDQPNKFIFVSFGLSRINTILPSALGNRDVLDLKKDQDENEFQNLHSKLQSINQIEFSEVSKEVPKIVVKTIKPFKL